MTVPSLLSLGLFMLVSAPQTRAVDAHESLPAAIVPALAPQPSQAPVQPAAGQPPIQQQLDVSRFDSLTALSLRTILEIATENNLPTAPLINRAYEGAARRVGGTKILQVVREHMAALSSAREALGTSSTIDELDAGARALRSGIDPRSLAAVRDTRKVGSAALPLTVLTDIVQRGVPAITARDAVTTIARMPTSDKALEGLQLTVAKNAVRGPGMAVDALQRYLRSTVSGAKPLAAPAPPDRKPIRPPPL